MNLSIEQQQAIQNGEPVRFNPPELGVECVVIRADVFETLAYDDSPLADDERRAMFIDTGKRAGWDDPEMDIYDDLDPCRRGRL